MRRSWGLSEARRSSSGWGRRSRSITRAVAKRVEQRLAARDASHRLDDVARRGPPSARSPAAPATIASNSASSSSNDVSIRQRSSGCSRADVAAHLDAAAVGQAHVEHGDVGTGERDARAGPPRRSRPRRRPRSRPPTRAGRARPGAPPRGRRAGTPSRLHLQRLLPSCPNLVDGRPSIIGAWRPTSTPGPTAAPAARRRHGGRLRVQPARDPAAHHRGGDRTGRGQVRRARRARREPYGAVRVHHRRHRRRTDRAASATCPRVTASSGCSSSIRSRCACPTSTPTPTATGSRRTTRR